jgi:hypothetical protein
MMRASELVKALNAAIAAHGDFLVYLEGSQHYYAPQPVFSIAPDTFVPPPPHDASGSWPILVLRHTVGVPR